MPSWLSFLLPYALKLVTDIGIPFVESKWPALKPILDEIVGVIGGDTMPSPQLLSAANHFNEKSGIIVSA